MASCVNRNLGWGDGASSFRNRNLPSLLAGLAVHWAGLGAEQRGGAGADSIAGMAANPLRRPRIPALWGSGLLAWGLLAEVAGAEPGGPRVGPPGGSSAELLERTYAEDPDPLLALRLAELAVEGRDCDEGLAWFERFFESCGRCDALQLGVKRFERTVERCVVSIDREAEVRGRASIPRSKEPVRSPADATPREVVDLLKSAREVRGPKAVRALLTLAEAGPKPSVRLLNELRWVAFSILSETNATKEQVDTLLRRLKKVDLALHDEFRERLGAASDLTALNELRAELISAITSRSAGGREPKSGAASCRPSDELEWGQLTVSSSPWSEVYLNGEPLGPTPVAKADALAGCVTLRLVRPGTGESLIKNVTIRSNKVAVVQVELETGTDKVRYE